MYRNEITASKRRVPLFLVDSTGTGLAGITWSNPVAADMRVSQAGGASANAAGVAGIDETGKYYYEFTQTETNTNGGYLLLDVLAKSNGTTTCRRYVVEVPLTDTPPTASDIATAVAAAVPTTAAIVAAVLAGVADAVSGATVKGVLARVDAFIRGRAVGLKGTIAEFFLGDGTTHAMQMVQDVTAGTRAAATDVHGD